MRPTRAGSGLAVAAVVLLVAGAGLGWLVAVVLGVAAAVALVTAGAVVLRRPPLVVRRGIHPERVSRGELAVGRLEVHNPTSRTSAAGRAVEQVGGTPTAVRVPRLRAGQTRTVTYRLPTGRRGVLTVGPLLVQREDPLGLVSAASRQGELTTLWVHPRTHPVRVPPSGRNAHLDGPTSDSAPRGSITFHTLREYVVGDDLRRVHWRSTARLGTLMVREHVDTSLPRLGVVLDTRRDSYAGEAAFEEAVDVAASLVAEAVRSGWPVRLVGTGDLDVASTGRATAGADLAVLLDRLAEVTAEDHGRPPATAAQALPGGTCLALVGGTVDGSGLGAVAGLRRRHDRVVLFRLGLEAGTSAPLQGIQVVAGTRAADVCAAWSGSVGR